MEGKAVDSENVKHILSTLRHWVHSWFTYCETYQEFCVSKDQFDLYLKINRNLFQSKVCNDNIDRLIGILMKYEHRLFHYHFIHKTTFGFIGDSIVEACNQSLKKGFHSVNSHMNIDTSALAQTKMIEVSTGIRER